MASLDRSIALTGTRAEIGGYSRNKREMIMNSDKEKAARVTASLSSSLLSLNGAVGAFETLGQSTQAGDGGREPRYLHEHTR